MLHDKVRHPLSFGADGTATCFEAYEIEGRIFFFTCAGFYKMSNNTVEEIRSFPADRYASVQYSHSLRAFYISTWRIEAYICLSWMGKPGVSAKGR